MEYVLFRAVGHVASGVDVEWSAAGLSDYPEIATPHPFHWPDIVVHPPAGTVLIELDGARSHYKDEGADTDLRKVQGYRENGFRLIRVRQNHPTTDGIATVCISLGLPQSVVAVERLSERPEDIRCVLSGLVQVAGWDEWITGDITEVDESLIALWKADYETWLDMKRRPTAQRPGTLHIADLRLPGF